jgi:amino acid transporter
MNQKSEGQQLASGTLGQAEVLFQAVAHLGPAGAAIVIFPFLTQYVGPSVPFLLAVCLVAVFLTALCVAELANHLPSAGGFVTYVGQGLGKRFGFFTAWAYFLYDPVIPTVSILVAAGFLEQVIKKQSGVIVPWWATTLVSLAIVHFVTYAGVKQSAKLNIILGVAECGMLLLLSIWVIAHAGVKAQSVIPFQFPESGRHALFLGFAFAMLLFCGFESAAPLAEETKDAKNAIPRTMISSLLIVGALWILTGYAMVLGFGIQNAGQMLQANENPFFSLANGVWHYGWILVAFALINSSLAASIAGQNAGSRVIFALGRAGVLPSVLARTHPRHKTPHVAITLQSVLNVVVSITLGIWLGPIGALNFIGVLIAIGIIVIYILANISVIPLFWKRYREEWRLLPHFIIPVLAVGLLALAFYYTVWPVPPKPLSIAEVFVAVWLSGGAVLAIFLRGRTRDALERAVSIVFLGNEGEACVKATNVQHGVLTNPAPVTDANASSTSKTD